jgi:hypothetical protein
MKIRKKKFVEKFSVKASINDVCYRKKKENEFVSSFVKKTIILCEELNIKEKDRRKILKKRN